MRKEVKVKVIERRSKVEISQSVMLRRIWPFGIEMEVEGREVEYKCDGYWMDPEMDGKCSSLELWLSDNVNFVLRIRGLNWNG